jgi:glycopeptide antibiotics resistance protein
LPFFDIIPVIIILALYLALAYVTHATEGFYVYDFLDIQSNSSGKVAGYIVGILLATLIVFLIVRYLIVFRIWVTEKKLGMTGKFSRHSGRRLVRDDPEQNLPLQNVTAK